MLRFDPPFPFPVPGGLVCSGACDALDKLLLTAAHASDSDPAALRGTTSVGTYARDANGALAFAGCTNDGGTAVAAGLAVRASGLAAAGRDAEGAPSPTTLNLQDCSSGSTVVASPLDRTVPTGFAEGTDFLYTGDNPIQTGVAANAIDRDRAAVVRGRVLGREGAPLVGVDVAIVGHPEPNASSRARPSGPRVVSSPSSWCSRAMRSGRRTRARG